MVFCYTSLYGLRQLLRLESIISHFCKSFLLIKSSSPQPSPNSCDCLLLSFTIPNTFFVHGLARVAEQSKKKCACWVYHKCVYPNLSRVP